MSSVAVSVAVEAVALILAAMTSPFVSRALVLLAASHISAPVPTVFGQY
ncbi:MAG: hypothetical protein ABI238_02290 [Terrimesophilobacter sp.]